MSEKKKPIHEIKLGRIRAAIWQNETKNGDVAFKVTFSRLYKDEDHWKDTDSFRRDDLLVVAKAADMAFVWIWRYQTSSGGATAEKK